MKWKCGSLEKRSRIRSYPAELFRKATFHRSKCRNRYKDPQTCSFWTEFRPLSEHMFQSDINHLNRRVELCVCSAVKPVLSPELWWIGVDVETVNAMIRKVRIKRVRRRTSINMRSRDVLLARNSPRALSAFVSEPCRTEITLDTRWRQWGSWIDDRTIDPMSKYPRGMILKILIAIKINKSIKTELFLQVMNGL